MGVQIANLTTKKTPVGAFLVSSKLLSHREVEYPLYKTEAFYTRQIRLCQEEKVSAFCF